MTRPRAPLFTGERTIERTTSVGNTVRVSFVPAEGERVRITDYQRKRAGSSQFRKDPHEVGQLATLPQLGVSESYQDVFGVHANAPAPTEAPKAKPRRRRAK